MKLRNFLLIFLIGFSGRLHAQDSLISLNAEQVLSIVKAYHPVVKQTDISIAKSKAEITQARAAFDPIISNYTARKTFNGLNYYDYNSPQVSIPTWYGIEIYSGVENLSGNRLDPTETVGQSSYLGINIPLAKNLLIDKRRAALRQSKIMNTLAKVEQQSIVNNLLMEAMEAYWHWVKAHQTLTVLENVVQVNEKRFNLVKQAYFLGERPGIDTVEALAQLNSFKFERNQRLLNFQNAGLELSAYLWKANGEAYVLPEQVVPQSGWESELNIQNFSLVLNDLMDAAEKNHPDLRQYDYKIESLIIDKRLKFQDLLPKVDLSYNHLAKGSEWFPNNGINNLFENNFQYGLKIAIPLRFSEGRGAYKVANLKLQETRLDLNQSRLKVQLKVQSYYNEFLNLKNQTSLQSLNFANYQQLVQAEETRFFNGESSMFLINARETKALEAQEKLIELKAKYFKTIYALQWSAGLLN
jgi:outer membrane protein TolC